MIYSFINTLTLLQKIFEVQSKDTIQQNKINLKLGRKVSKGK